MTVKKPTQRQISSLVGGKPLDYNFDPETGLLAVIGPTGQKFRFKPQDWTESKDVEKDETEKPKSKGSQGSSKQKTG